jgi:transposase
LHFELKLGQRQIARSANVSQGTVHEYLERFRTAGLSWPLPAEMTEQELESALFADDGNPDQEPPAQRSLPDFARLHEELQRHKHTTLSASRTRRTDGRCKGERRKTENNTLQSSFSAAC